MSEEIKEEQEKVNNENEENVVTEGNKEMQSMKIELDETTDRLKRVMAEFENYKKRNAKERDMLYSSVLSDIILKFLPIVDNLEKAVKAETKDEEFKQGIVLLLKQFEDTFKSLGVETIETVGKPFDPEVHEAVSSVQDDSLGEKIVKEEFRKGYKIGYKVIRHAMVVVAN